MDSEDGHWHNKCDVTRRLQRILSGQCLNAVHNWDLAVIHLATTPYAVLALETNNVVIVWYIKPIS